MTNEYTYIITALLLILIFFKTYLFFSSTTNKSWAKWFFFNSHAVYNSRSEKSRKLKILQNKLTWYVLILIVIDVAVFFALKK
jgi:hypothetical protein